MTQDIFLSVVIPSYNEEHNIRSGVLKLVYDYLAKQDYTWEVVIVDDGSSDATANLASEFSKKHSGFTRENGKPRKTVNYYWKYRCRGCGKEHHRRRRRRILPAPLTMQHRGQTPVVALLPLGPINI